MSEKNDASSNFWIRAFAVAIMAVSLIWGARYAFAILGVIVFIYLALIAWANFMNGSNGGGGGW